MTQSETIKTLLDAMTKAQAEFPTLPKDKNGYNYKYTDLETVISTLRPILAKNNLGFMQTLTTLDNGKWAITTRIFHNAGEWIEDTTPLPEVSLAKGNAAQNVGAAITYMKRYALCAMFGISSDEDVDASSMTVEQSRPTPAQKTYQKPVPKNAVTPKGGEDTPEQRKKINAILAATRPDGSKVFGKEDFENVMKWRLERTADQVIEYLEKLEKERNPFPEDIPGQAENTMAEQPEIF